MRKRKWHISIDGITGGCKNCKHVTFLPDAWCSKHDILRVLWGQTGRRCKDWVPCSDMVTRTLESCSDRSC